MNMEYENYCDGVLISSMSSMTVKSNRKMINYIDLNLRKEVVFLKGDLDPLWVMNRYRLSVSL